MSDAKKESLRRRWFRSRCDWLTLVDFINSVVAELGEWNPLWAYIFLAVSAFLENVLPPVPGDVVVIFSAYLVGRGVLDWVPVYLCTCFGGVVGFWVMYTIGARYGSQIVQSRMRFASEDRLQKVALWLDRYGIWLILANRFLSGIRSVIALSAGVGRMGWKVVFCGGLVSMGIWNGLLIYLGLLLGDNWKIASELLSDYNRVVLSALALVAAVALVRVFRRRKSGC